MLDDRIGQELPLAGGRSGEVVRPGNMVKVLIGTLDMGICRDRGTQL